VKNRYEKGHPGKPILECNRAAVAFLRANSAYTIREIHLKFPGSSLEVLRSHAAYHNLPYKKERVVGQRGAKRGPIIVDPEKEAKLQAERDSAPAHLRAHRLLAGSFESLARLWGDWIKK